MQIDLGQFADFILGIHRQPKTSLFAARGTLRLFVFRHSWMVRCIALLSDSADLVESDLNEQAEQIAVIHKELTDHIGFNFSECDLVEVGYLDDNRRDLWAVISNPEYPLIKLPRHIGLLPCQHTFE